MRHAIRTKSGQQRCFTLVIPMPIVVCAGSPVALRVGLEYRASPLSNPWPIAAADIKENGLRYPIVLDANGDLIDGPNRKIACERAGLQPHYTVLDGQDPIGFIPSMNVARRHPSKGQKAMAAGSRERF
jgi:hypothetical protein